MNDELKAQVKRKCTVTWDDEGTDARIEDVILSAEPTIRHKLGITDPQYDFSVSGVENTLFLAYCLYEWEHISYEFDDKYANDIAQARAKQEVEQYGVDEDA